MNKNEKQRKVEAEGEKGVSSAEKRGGGKESVSHSCENLQYIISNSNPEVTSDDCCTRTSDSLYSALFARKRCCGGYDTTVADVRWYAR
jgi:hypothetical protein